MRKWIAFSCLLISGCGSLERQALAVNPGDTKNQVVAALGTPGDRQFNGNLEAWQYCQTGAGFGYHDFRTVFFREGLVISMSSYKDHTPASGCTGHFRQVQWDVAAL